MSALGTFDAAVDQACRKALRSRAAALEGEADKLIISYKKKDEYGKLIASGEYDSSEGAVKRALARELRRLSEKV